MPRLIAEAGDARSRLADARTYALAHGIQHVAVDFRVVSSLVAFAAYQALLCLGIGMPITDVLGSEYTRYGIGQQLLAYVVTLALYIAIARRLAVYQERNFQPSERLLAWGNTGVTRWTLLVIVRIGSSCCAGIAYSVLAAAVGNGRIVLMEELLWWRAGLTPFLGSLFAMYGISWVIVRMIKGLLVWAYEPTELLISAAKRHDRLKGAQLGEGDDGKLVGIAAF